MNRPSPEDFLEACGARSPVVLEIERQGQSEKIRHTLSLPFALIGRDERADLHLDDKSVSSRHAYLQMAAGQLWYVDLGSRTGTHEQPGQSAGLLRGDQELRIGPFVVRRDDGAPSGNDAATLSNPLARDSYDSSRLPRVGLDFLEGAAGQPRWMVDRRLTLVGCAANCRVRLHSSTVSRTHCALLQTPAGLWVVDLLSREGTCVNGTAVRWARLEDADKLRIGQFVVRVRILDRPQHAALPAPLAMETATTNALLPPAQSLVPSAAVAEALPADLEGLLSVLKVAATPSDVRTATGGAAEAMLLPMIRQFALMQQQMFDQFQQSLLMMVQMFSGLHRDQLQLIRQELSQLSEVTRELQTLLAEQARQAPVLTPTEANSSAKAEFVPPPQPAAPGGTPSQASPPCPSGPAEKRPIAAEVNSGQPNTEVHAWLARRLATLQQERQSRWQRILHVLTGQ